MFVSKWGSPSLRSSLMIGWTFVPGSASYEGTQTTCMPASVDRSSEASELDGRELACRPVAATREIQRWAGLATAVSAIWATYAILTNRSGASSST